MNIASKVLLTVLLGILYCSTVSPNECALASDSKNITEVVKNPQSEPGGL